MNKCLDYSEMMQRLLDDELCELEIKRLEKHMELCPACAEEYATLQELNRLFRDVQLVEPPADLHQMIMSKVLAEGATQKVNEASPQRMEEPCKVDEEMQGVGTLNNTPAILAMILIATLNGFFFVSRLIPLLGVGLNSTQQRLATDLFLQFFTRFSIVGQQTGEALLLAFRAVLGSTPWHSTVMYIIIAGISIIGCMLLVTHGQKGGDWT